MTAHYWLKDAGARASVTAANCDIQRVGQALPEKGGSDIEVRSWAGFVFIPLVAGLS